MPKRVKFPELDRLRQQIENLEWLLDQSRFVPSLWKTRITLNQEDRMPVVQLVLRRGGRKIYVSATANPQWSSEPGAERHFWIDGNHWYDRFAVGTLADALGPTEEEQDVLKLCDLAEAALNRVETGDDTELVSAIGRVREATCHRK